MTLVELLTKVAKGYPDGDMDGYFSRETGLRCDGENDLLAQALVVDIGEIYDASAGDGQQLEDARSVLRYYQKVISGLIAALNEGS